MAIPSLLGRGVTDRIPSPSDVGAKLVEVVDRAVESRWDLALRRADEVAHLERDDRIRQITRRVRNELIATGAASGGVAAFPGVGTAATIASSSGDLAVATIRLTDLILTIGALHGLRDATVEERRLWVLAVLAFGDEASDAVRAIAPELAKGLEAGSLARVSFEVLRRTNRSLARTLVSRYGRKRVAISVGKLLPFGFGAAIGAGGNALLVRSVGRSADRFFARR